MGTKDGSVLQIGYLQYNPLHIDYIAIDYIHNIIDCI